MFTGIVQAQGTVTGLTPARLSLAAPNAWPGDPWQIGESLAVDGCCLTLVAAQGGLEFDLSPETLSRTTLGRLGSSSSVNLERALRVGDRFGGHVVLGHVDTVGELLRLADGGLSEFKVEDAWARHLVDKGSIALNGVSLTVVRPNGGTFGVALIPQTLGSTNLGTLQAGGKVNVEFDALAKYALSPR